MTSDEALTLLRSGLSDEAEHTLWSDTELYAALNDAQVMFCRLTDGISDASTDTVTLLPMPVASDWLPLHTSILKIRSAHLVSTGAEIGLINAEDMPKFGIRFDGRTGPLRRLVVGMEENKLRCSPTTNLGDSIRLSVFRKPLLRVDAPGIEFEVGEDHHLHLLDWAKSLAYLKQDSETLDKSKSVEFEQKFRAYCAAATQEQRMKRHKIRTVAYGGN